RRMPGTIKGALSNLGGLLRGAGKAIIDGFVGGLRGAWDKGMNFIKGIGSWIADHKGPISYDRKLLVPAGKAIMNGLTKSMQAAMPDLERVVTKATSTILGLDAKPKIDLQANAKGAAGAGGQTVVNNYNVEITG